MANRREKVEVVRFPLLGLQNHCRWWLQPWNQKTIASCQESDDKPRQCVEKQRHYSADKGPFSQGYGLPSGHMQLWQRDRKKAEHQKIDAFELRCWRRLLKVPWTARRLNKSILRVINPDYSLEGLMLKLKLQYFGQLMQRTDSLEKTLTLGKIEGRKRRGLQRMRWFNEMVVHWLGGHEFEQTPEVGDGQQNLACCSPWGHEESDTTEWLY